MRVSVIVPILNERAAIEPLIARLSAQTFTPDEVVVADGGSTDGTREKLDELTDTWDRLRIVDGPGGIAENRNAAIRMASGEIIACTDAGCLPDLGWLEALAQPFEVGAEWVAGFYRPEGATTASTAAGVVMMTVLEEVDPDHFLPGGSSQAFLRSAWERVGGFPEGLVAGEDTLFGEKLRAAGYRPHFAAGAVVGWHPPASLGDMARKARMGGRADGTNRVRTGAYLRVIAAYWGLPLVALAGAVWRPWLGLAVLAVPIGVVAYRTRHKYRWVPGPGKWLLVPIAHLRQQLAQSLGWLEGFGPKNILRKLGGRLLCPVRQMLPATVTARLDEDRAPVRHNVDVFIDDPRTARRWLKGLPDTYRVIADVPPDVTVVRATIDLRPGREPAVAPVAVEAFPGVIEETGDLDRDASANFALLRQTGLPYVLAPSPGGDSRRDDPVTGAGSVVILAAVPLHDVGGGSRGAQLAQELATRGYHVTYVHRYDAGESMDLGLRFIHTRLEEQRWDDFDLDAYVARSPVEPRLVVVEFPHPSHLGPAERLKAVGFRIVYDLIDRWEDPALGGWWYQQEAERRFIDLADALTASAPSLVRDLGARSGREVVEVPNAVNAAVFGNEGPWERPRDLPEGGPIFEYHGSLYGDWFDWEAVGAIAEAFPAAWVVLIGDRPAKTPTLPRNVLLLGLKPQASLPAYLAHTDVGLIPFVVSETTGGVSPLKVFEYLAMGVTVAGPPLEPLTGLAGVFTYENPVEAVTTALAGPRPDRAVALAAHAWSERLGRIFGALGLSLAPLGTPVVVKVRPVRHYRPDERLIT
ncbi:MAG: glycosyltransferase [Actinomycetota bacterium]